MNPCLVRVGPGNLEDPFHSILGYMHLNRNSTPHPSRLTQQPLLNFLILQLKHKVGTHTVAQGLSCLQSSLLACQLPKGSRASPGLRWQNIPVHPTVSPLGPTAAHSLCSLEGRSSQCFGPQVYLNSGPPLSSATL